MNLASNEVTNYVIATMFALLVHGVVIGLVSMNWGEATITHSVVTPYYIEAEIVSENPHGSRDERVVDSQKTRRAHIIEQRRDMEERQRKQERDYVKRQLSEAEFEKPQQASVNKWTPQIKKEIEPKIGLESEPFEFENELILALKSEEDSRKAITDDEKAMAYVAQIQREIVQNWSRPPSARNGMETLLRVMLIPTGEVIDVKIEDSSGSDAFDRSAVLAVTKARRFVVPRNLQRFERDFREFTVLFRPEDLRL